MEDVKNDELTEKIIGCAFRVYNLMGFGFLESVYENCLLVELKETSRKPQDEPSRLPFPPLGIPRTLARSMAIAP